MLTHPRHHPRPCHPMLPAPSLSRHQVKHPDPPATGVAISDSDAGCVRRGSKAARTVFGATAVATRIVVKRSDLPTVRPTMMILRTPTYTGRRPTRHRRVVAASTDHSSAPLLREKWGQNGDDLDRDNCQMASDLGKQCAIRDSNPEPAESQSPPTRWHRLPLIKAR